MKDRLCTVRNWLIAGLAATLSLAVASAQPYAYVSNTGANNVSVVDNILHTKVATISVLGLPSGMAMTPDGSLVFVACQRANNVAVISTASNTVVNNITVGTTPIRLAITPNGSQVYVANKGSNTVSVIDVPSQTVIGTVSVGSNPDAVSFSSDGARAYVTNLYDATVTIISTASKSVLNTFAAASGPNGAAVLSSGNVYVANQYSSTVTVHDSAGNLLSTISGFSAPNSIAATPNGSRVFVTNGNSKSVAIIDTGSNTLIATLPTGLLPATVAISADGTKAYATNQSSYTLTQIDVASNTVTNTMPGVGIYPYGIALPPAGGPPPPPVCTFSLNPTSASFTAAGGVGNSVAVTASPSCGAWTAVSNVGWAQINTGANGNGSGTVTYSVNPNLGAGALSGTLTIAGQTFTINQAGLACSYSLSSNATSVGSGGSGGSVNLTAGGGCGWTSQTDSPAWLTIIGGFSGSGNGTVSFTVTPNAGIGSRTGNLTIGGQNYAVTQSGVAFSAIRVNCGGGQFTDGSGNLWVAGGEPNFNITASAISGTTSPYLYQSEAWSTGTLQYQYTVPNGSFTVKLHFAEFYETQAGRRAFNIVVNGTTFSSGYDIFASAGGMVANDVVIPVLVSNGQITIQLVPVTGRAKLNALEIF